MKYVKGNIYTNSSISSLSELLSYVFSGVFFKKIGMKPSFFICFTISIIGAALYIIFENNENLIPLFILLAKFGVTSTFNTVYLANAMMFPSILVASSFGICNIFARCATIIAPEMAEVPLPTPMIVFIILDGLGAMFSILLIKPKLKPNFK